MNRFIPLSGIKESAMFSRKAWLLLARVVFLSGMPAGTVGAELKADTEQDERVKFDPVFLQSVSGEMVDISRFEQGSSALPGIYPADIYINGEQVSHENVQFTEYADMRVMPCLTREILRKINFNYSQLPASYTQRLQTEQACYPLQEVIPQGKISFDSGAQRLDISIPQAMMQNTARGSVSPELWDAGIPAFLLGYTANTYTTQSRGESYNASYVGINAGFNMGAWYFRHDGSLNWQDKNGAHYQSINNYVQRDIPAIKGRMRFGETSTQGQLFDSLPFKGTELVSEERMLPKSQRGYAPDIRGIARTNARVSVRQNGRVIYEITVAPGAFVIDDLYPTGYGGNLEVIVTESDGSVQTFMVPYAAVTQLLRPGAHRYDIVVGKLNDLSIDSDPVLYQLTYQRGISNSVTGYGGLQASTGYTAVQVGAALGTTIGAFSADVTQSRTRLNTTEKRVNDGQSYQISYSKFLPKTNSNLTLAAYRYSTEGYYDYLSAMRAMNAEKNGQTAKDIWRPRNRLNVTVNQGLMSGWGQIYLTGYSQDYWNRNNSDLQYQLGYSNSYGRVSYSVSAGRVRGMRGGMETNWLFNMSVPLGKSASDNLPTLMASLNKSSNGRTGEQVSLSGSAGHDYEYTYGGSVMRDNQNAGSSVALNGGYRTPYTNLSANYGQGKNYQNASFGVSGTAIAWKEGMVLSPYMGDTFAVVEAKGAKGAKVGGYSGIRIDPWGHAAIPYLNPYEMNEVSINPQGLPYGVELSNTSSKVAPYSGAVSKVVFNTQLGTPLLIIARQDEGNPVVFGAEVFDHDGNNVGSVGQNGQIFARVSRKKDTLKVRWGNGHRQQCLVEYKLPATAKKEEHNELIRLSGLCHYGS